MIAISLRRLELAGFRSFRQRVIVDFTGPAGLRFVTGHNEVEPRLGANGSGKSSLWEALVWCLFNVSSAGLRPSQLMHRDCPQMDVQAVFLIDGRNHTVARSYPPSRLLVDGEPADAEAVARLLGLNRPRFLQSVLYGQMAPLFLDLPVSERGRLLDEVLELELWQRLGQLAKQQADAVEQELVRLRQVVASYDGQLAGMQQQIPDLEQRLASWQDEQRGMVEKAIQNVEREDAALDGLCDALRAAKETLNSIRVADDTLPQLQRTYHDNRVEEGLYKRLLAERRETLEFFEQNTVCPSCGQPISEQFCQDEIDKARAAIARIKHKLSRLNADMQAQNSRLLSGQRQEREREEQRRDAERRIGELQGRIAKQREYVDHLVKQAEDLAERPNPYEPQLKKLQAECQELSLRVRRQRRESLKLRGQADLLEYWGKHGFKLLRLFQLRRFMGYLQVETGNALEAMGLVGWQVTFVTETETQAGDSRPGVRLLVTPPGCAEPAEHWSGGEMQRIKLAVALGLADLVQHMAGVHFDFEVWDEPSAWLSPEGIDDLLNLLNFRAEQRNRRIWLLDHRQLAGIHGFSETWTVVKDQSGSHIERLNGPA